MQTSTSGAIDEAKSPATDGKRGIEPARSGTTLHRPKAGSIAGDLSMSKNRAASGGAEKNFNDDGAVPRTGTPLRRRKR